jgi:hypothetical protein
MTEQEKDKIAALEARVAELEEKAKPKPEPEPFKPQPYQRYDPTEGMRMPPSALQAMVAAEPRGFMKAVVHDNRAPTGRPPMIPSSQQISGGSGGGDAAPVNKSGWVDAAPIGPPPGIRYVDAQIDEQDRRDRIELARKLGKG